LTAALQQVQSTLRELDLGLGVYCESSGETDYLDIRPVSGQLGSLRKFPSLRRLKAPIVTLLGWSPGELPLRIAEVVPAGLTHLGLTEDMELQCTYEWNEELVLEELAAFLGVWRRATPDLQVMEVWLSPRWKDADVEHLRMMCKEAGILCFVHLCNEPSSSPMTQWVRQGPYPKFPSPSPRTPPPAVEPLRCTDKVTWSMWNDEPLPEP
jgi:hypothetical protein